MKTQDSRFDWECYFAALSTADARALLLDYDGTLAPFRVARDTATPDPTLRDAVAQILAARRTRVAIISGRTLSELIPLIGLDPLPELWGCHGWERQTAGGEYRGPELSPVVRQALDEALGQLGSLGSDGRYEEKPASVAVHWRGMDRRASDRLRKRVRAAWEPLLLRAELVLREFDGGVELLARGRDKGYAVRQVLRELEENATVAYAGDDRTDEDAFRALAGRGLGILVGEEQRQTEADLWLPPREFARFLRSWATVDREGVLT